MSAPVSLSIARVVDGWDMRVRHELRDQALDKLRHGQCLVALNGKRTMARIIDCVGGIYDLYADHGMRFDIDTVSQMMQKGMKVRLAGVIRHDRELVRAA